MKLSYRCKMAIKRESFLFSMVLTPLVRERSTVQSCPAAPFFNDLAVDTAHHHAEHRTNAHQKC